MLKNVFIVLFLLLTLSKSFSEEAKVCDYWGKRNKIPCITVKKTPNTSLFSEQGVNKITINKKQLEQTGAVDAVDVLNSISGLDLKQNGSKGQLTSLFLRGTNSNHTLVLLNGIPINDQSTTQGLHNFGQDFVQTFEKIEVYKGPSGSHFGPSAIGGAINFITSVDYTNKISINGFDGKNNSINSNYIKNFDSGWNINFKGSNTNSKNGSARNTGISSLEEDGSKNHQLNLIAEKWITDNLKFNSTVYSRKTKTHYDASSSDPSGYANDKMNVIQNSFNRITKNSNDLLTFHINNYDREYDESGYFDEYDSTSIVIKAERNIKPKNKISFGYGSEYKYDKAEFTDNGSWSTPTVDGYVSNIGIYANSGYQYSENSTFSLYGRADNHKTTNLNSTYKINFSHILNKLKFGLTHSTGLRNPSLYELYGSNGLSSSYKHVANPNAKPERSKSDELNVTYFFSNNFLLENTLYRSSIKDALLYNSSFKGGTGYTNSKSSLKQKGVESKLIFKNNNQSLSIFNTISSSRKADGDHQLNRPNNTYGINYSANFNNKLFGPLTFNYNYKHYGKAFDYAPTVKKVDSTDIMNMSLFKNMKYGTLSLNIKNLLDEKYQRPHGYSQDRRIFRFGFSKNF